MERNIYLILFNGTKEEKEHVTKGYTLNITA